MQTRLLRLRTRTQHTLALIVTAWRVSSAILECVAVSVENAQKVKNVTLFCCLSIFATAGF
jgi:hypothetical protein